MVLVGEDIHVAALTLSLLFTQGQCRSIQSIIPLAVGVLLLGNSSYKHAIHVSPNGTYNTQYRQV